MRYTEAGSNKLKIEMKKIVLFFVLVIGFCVLTTESYAQKRPTKVKVAFEVDSMPQQLLLYLNGNIKAEEKLAANAQVVEQFKGVYTSLDSKRKQQVVDMYNPRLTASASSRWWICTTPPARPNWSLCPTMST